MDVTDVTNADFEKFVRATGYVTLPERMPTKEEFPNVPPENLVAGSIVFTPTKEPVPLDDNHRWWAYVKGADWRHPTGPSSNIKGHENDPVVQVAYDDALAYAKWAGKRLPTEAEWEFAQRGGLSGKLYAWGDEFTPGGEYMANTYQGNFPVRDSGADGNAGISPVKSFPPNGYGLYDMAGNVWQWCRDWYDRDFYRRPEATERNPECRTATAIRSERGGSWVGPAHLCRSSHRRGRNPDARGRCLGFRCVGDADGLPGKQ
jgi:formylglycine-generating enzyme required for sulfatase activity